MPWHRRAFRGRSLERALNIADLREIARRRIPGFVFEYAEGGAEDEVSLRGNLEALARLRFVPPTLIDTSARQQRTSILGLPAGSPLVIAPTGLNGLLRRDGDVALARAAARAGIPCTLSTVSTTRLEEVARRAGGRLWMQLYVVRERAVARDIMQRAGAAGFEALVFTTDANVFGSREWDRRGYRSPGKPTLRAMLDTLRHPRWMLEVLARMPRFRNLEDFLPPGAATPMGASTVIPRLFDATLRWDDLADGCRCHARRRARLRRHRAQQPRRAAARLVRGGHGRAAGGGGRGRLAARGAGGRRLPPRHRRAQGARARRPGGADRTRAALRSDRRW
jgi:(S)-mandelate dehydrogenase